MLTCFFIISQVVVINTEQKKKTGWFHLITFWLMKINSRKVQVQPALTLCAQVEEGEAWDSLIPLVRTSVSKRGREGVNAGCSL